MMTTQDVLAVLDALLGTQTRDHDDLDLVIARVHVASICHCLAHEGFMVRADELPTCLVLRAGERAIDLHPVCFDAEGGGEQDLPAGTAFRYPREGFEGKGRVSGREVACLSAAVQDLCHRGYVLDETDDHDMRLLHAQFDVPTS